MRGKCESSAQSRNDLRVETAEINEMNQNNETNEINKIAKSNSILKIVEGFTLSVAFHLIDLDRLIWT